MHLQAFISTTMINYSRAIIVSIASFGVALLSQGQVRPDIYDAQFDGLRDDLFNLIIDYIDEEVVEQHCYHQMITGGHIHSDFDFLPFHRMYIEGLEDYLLIQGHPEFVP